MTRVTITGVPYQDDEAWKEMALCRRVDSEIFFPTSYDDESVARAAVICRRCHVQPECMAYALRWANGEGIWAGIPGPNIDRRARALRRRGLSVPAPPVRDATVASVREDRAAVADLVATVRLILDGTD